MATYQLSIVPEPPTDQEFMDLLATDALAGNVLMALNFGGKNAPLDLKISQLIGYLRLSLAQYADKKTGNEAFYPLRRQALRQAVERCDQLAEALVHKITANGLFGHALKLQYGKLSDAILSVRLVCDEKSNLLLKIERYLSNKNLTDLADVLKGTLSKSGYELRTITGAHLGEYFSGFHFSIQDSTVAKNLFLDWQDLMDKAEREPVPNAVPPYPVFLEGKLTIPFSKRSDSNPFQHLKSFYTQNFENNFTDLHSTVEYDGTEKRSRHYVDAKDGTLRRQHVDSSGKWHDELLNCSHSTTAFIVDSKENMYAYTHVMGEQHHSTATAGRAVVGAGKLSARDGKVTFVDDKSGHYAPTPRHMLNCLKVMEAKNILGSEAKLYLDFAPGKPTLRAAELLRAARNGFTYEDMAKAIVPGPNAQVDPDIDFIIYMFTDSSYESKYYTELQPDMEKNLRRMVTNRPHQELAFTKLHGDSPVLKTRPRRNAQAPLPILAPLLPLPGPATTPDPVPVPAPAPSVRGRRNAVFKR